MKAGNARIMAAAAVVALCLLFSWVYLDDGTGVPSSGPSRSAT